MRQTFVSTIVAASAASAGVAYAQPLTPPSGTTIDDYFLADTFSLPESFDGVGDFNDNILFDALDDGRLLILNGNEVSVETGVGTGQFAFIDVIPDYNPAFGSPFLKVSPDGSRAIAGTNGGGSVVVFDVADPTSVQTFGIGDFDAAWIDDVTVAITNTSGVVVLDVLTGERADIIDNVGGAAGGIAFDENGTLFTGNGFDFEGGNTGFIAAFDEAQWRSALDSGTPLDFQTDGTPVADLLSAGSLGFDGFGNLLVGGGDFFSGSGDFGYAGLVDAATIDALLAGEAGEIVTAASPEAVLRQIESPEDTILNFESPAWVLNEATGDLYLSYFNNSDVFVFRIPTPGALATAGLAGMALAGRRRAGAR